MGDACFSRIGGSRYTEDADDISWFTFSIIANSSFVAFLLANRFFLRRLLARLLRLNQFASLLLK